MLAAAKKSIGHFATGIVLAVFLVSQVAAQSAATLEVQADPVAQQVLRDAEARLAAGDAAGAWAILSPREARLAGNLYYDYLLGVAALDTGRTSEAIFSLQRALSTEPRYSGAKMELARAYFEAGDTQQARPLFVSLLGENPPAGVREILNRYVAAIDRRPARPARPAARFTSYFEFGAGYDSNANGSTDNDQFLGFTLSPNNVEVSSPIIEAAAGFNYTRPNSNQSAWYLGGRGSYRHNTDASFVDSGVASGVAGLTWRRGAAFGRVGLDGYWAARDGRSNEAYGGADMLLGRAISDRWDLSLGVRAGAQRFADEIEVLDVDRVLATAAASYQFSSLGNVSIELVAGKDNEKQDGSPYGNDKFGGRLGLRAPVGVSGDSALYWSVGLLSSDYDGLFFGSPRKDEQLSTALQIEFRDIGLDGLSLIPRIRYVDNDSDIELYTYDRVEVGLLLRWMPR